MAWGVFAEQYDVIVKPTFDHQIQFGSEYWFESKLRKLSLRLNFNGRKNEEDMRPQ